MSEGIPVPLGRSHGRFEFVGYSLSHAHEHTAWFFCPEAEEEGVLVSSVLSFFGNFTHCRPTAKSLGLMTLSLCESYHTLELVRDQIVINPSLDCEGLASGFGRMSLSLAQALAKRLILGH